MAQPTPEEIRRERIRRERERRAAMSASQPSPIPSGQVDFTQSTQTAPAPVRKADERPQIGRAIQTGLTRGVAGTAGMYGAIGNLIGENVPGMGFLQNPFGFEGATRALENLTGREQYQPQGRLEEAVSLMSEFAPGAGVAGGARRATMGGTSLLGSLGREATEEVPGLLGAVAGQQALYGGELQGMGELGGSLLGIPASYGRAMANSAEMAIRNRTRDISQEDWKRGLERARLAEELGFPITPDEALRSPQLQSVSAQLMDRPQGAQMAAMRDARMDMAQGAQVQPGGFRNLVDRFIDENLVRRPQAARGSAEAASNAIKDIQAQRTAAVRPFYEAARERTPANDVPIGRLQELDDELARRALEWQPGSPGLARIDEFRSRLISQETGGFETNAGVLDNVYREFRDMLDANPASGDVRYRPGVGVIAEPVEMLRGITNLNPSLRQGRQLYQEFTNQQVVPILEGPIGILAAGDGNRAKQLDTMIGNFIRGQDLDATDFNTAVRQMSRVEGGREALEAVTAAYFANLADRSTAATRQGPQLNPSAAFSSMLQGDARRNLNSLFDALDRADRAQGVGRANRRLAFDNLLNVLDSTQAPARRRGSALSDGELAAGSGALTRRILATFRPLMTPAAAISQTISSGVQGSRAREGWERIGAAMTQTGPEGVQAIRRMADAGSRGPAAARAAAELMVRGRIFYDPETGEPIMPEDFQ